MSIFKNGNVTERKYELIFCDFPKLLPSRNIAHNRVVLLNHTAFGNTGNIANMANKPQTFFKSIHVLLLQKSLQQSDCSITRRTGNIRPSEK